MNKKIISSKRNTKNMNVYNQENMPSLRFKEFNDEWKEYKITQLFNINVAKDLDNTNLSEYKINKKLYPVYGNAIENYGLMGYYDTYQYEPNTITVTARGINIGTAILRETKFNSVGRLLTLIPLNIDVNSYFVVQYINSNFRIYIESTSIPQLTAPSFKLNKIKLPSIKEQEKIASFLSAIDKKIDLMEKKHNQYEKLKQYLLQNMFPRKNMEIPVLFFNTCVWNLVELNDIGSEYNGLSGKTKEDFGIGCPYITYKNVFDNEFIDIRRLEHVDIKEDEKQNKVQYGDIFFTISSETPDEVATASLLLEDIQNCYLNSFCFGFRLNDFKTVNPIFLVYYLRSPILKKEIFKLAQGSTRFNISKKELMKLKIKFPSYEEQTKISNLLMSIDKKINSINIKLNLLKQYKKGLLQKMFV